MAQQNVFEEFRVTGEELITRVRELIREGNVSRVIIKNTDDRTLVDLPLNAGVLGMGGLFVIAPILTAIGTAALYMSEYKIMVKRDESTGADTSTGAGKEDPYEVEPDK